MSRKVDASKSIKKMSADDLRYALDRGLITDPKERSRASALLADGGDAEEPEEETEETESEEDEGFNPGDHKVEEVIDYAEGEDVTVEEVEAIIASEQAGKNRPSLIEKLEALISEDEEEEES